jgi:flagellar assembly protein FliH
VVEVTTSLSKVLKLRGGLDVVDDAKVIPVQAVVPFAVVLEPGLSDHEPVTSDDMNQRLNETRAQCEHLLSQAHAQAEQIAAEAYSRAQGVLEDAHQQGFQSGYAAGLARVQEDTAMACQTKIEEAAQVLHRADDNRRRLLKDMHSPLTSICLDAVKSLLHRELIVQQADVERMVCDLLQYVTESTKVEVRVHPNDYSAATDAHPTWQSAKFGEWEVIVVPDSKVSEGGCEVRSQSGRVDATVETKLELLQSTLMTVMERGVAQYAAAHD